MISGFVVDTPAYSLFYFGFAVFLTMFAVVVADQMPLSAGLAFVIAEISGMVIALREIQEMLSLLHESQSTTAILVAEDIWLGRIARKLAASKTNTALEERHTKSS